MWSTNLKLCMVLMPFNCCWSCGMAISHAAVPFVKSMKSSMCRSYSLAMSGYAMIIFRCLQMPKWKIRDFPALRPQCFQSAWRRLDLSCTSRLVWSTCWLVLLQLVQYDLKFREPASIFLSDLWWMHVSIRIACLKKAQVETWTARTVRLCQCDLSWNTRPS